MATESTDNQGWVRLYRKSLDSRVWHNPYLWQLWCYCLLRANHKPCWASVKTGRGQTEVYLESGQFIFGRFSAAKDLRTKPDATYKRLLKLKTIGNITTQNKAHFTVVSLCNWDYYQNTQAEITTQVTPKYHPSNTDKNDENENKKMKESHLQIFNHWNKYQGKSVSKLRDSEKTKIVWKSHKLRADGSIAPEIINAIEQALKGNRSVEEICGAVGNYAQVVLSKDYFWTYTWSLPEFLTRGEEKHKNAPRKWWRFLPDNFIEEHYLTEAAKRKRASKVRGPSVYELAKQQTSKGKNDEQKQTA